MASPSGIRDIKALARRVHQRWLEYRRRHPTRSVPISDSLSRILEHDPDYTPQRRRVRHKPRRLLQNPGVFTLKEIADALETTVGDLLGEPHYTAPSDALTDSERRLLRDAVSLLRQRFDLDDERLALPFGSEGALPVPPREFIVGDYDYPRAFHVWIAASGDAALDPRLPRELHEPQLRVIRICGDSMAPELRDGWKAVVDTERTAPAENALVAVYVPERGAVLGRWHETAEGIVLRKANPAAEPVTLPREGGWVVVGTVVSVVTTSAAALDFGGQTASARP